MCSCLSDLVTIVSAMIIVLAQSLKRVAAECSRMMKEHASKDPALVAEIEKIKQEWKDNETSKI